MILIFNSTITTYSELTNQTTMNTIITPHDIWGMAKNANPSTLKLLIQIIQTQMSQKDPKWQTWEFTECFQRWAHMREPVLSKSGLGYQNWRDDIPKELCDFVVGPHVGPKGPHVGPKGPTISEDPTIFVKTAFAMKGLGKMEQMFWRISLPYCPKKLLAQV